jgi:hypothetical protein
LFQPCDVSDDPNPDVLCELLNDAFQKGYEKGFEDRGNPDVYDAIVRATKSDEPRAEDTGDRPKSRIVI